MDFAENKKHFRFIHHLIEENNREKENLNEETLAVNLLHSLHSKDEKSLQLCFEANNEEIIENVVQKILSSKIIQLLEILLKNLTSNIKNAKNEIIWVKYLLKHHSKFIMTKLKNSEILTNILKKINDENNNFISKKILICLGKINLIFPEKSIDLPIKKIRAKTKENKIEKKEGINVVNRKIKKKKLSKVKKTKKKEEIIDDSNSVSFEM